MQRPQRKAIRLDPRLYAEMNRVFSVTVGTAPRAPVFADVAFGRDCVELLRHAAEHSATQVLAYCLMPDHVHLLLRVGQRPLTSVLQSWKSQCWRLRRSRGNPATFWQRSFHDHALRAEEDLKSVAEYILHNPVRAGLVADWHDYPLAGSFAWQL